MTDISEMLQALPSMNIDALRRLWRDHFGEPPPLRSGDIMRRALAERIQQGAGNIDLERRLAKVASSHRTGRKPTVRTTSFKTGSILQREWQGVRHQVEVVDGGYRWNGEVHKSLSSIARAITGSRWNGPRFFGLREEAA